MKSVVTIEYETSKASVSESFDVETAPDRNHAAALHCRIVEKLSTDVLGCFEGTLRVTVSRQ